MYKKRENYDSNLTNDIACSIADEIRIYNRNVDIAVPKFYKEKIQFGKTKYKVDNKKNKEVIYVSSPIDQIIVPNEYAIDKNNVIYLIKAKNISAKLVQSKIRFIDDSCLDIELENKNLLKK